MSAEDAIGYAVAIFMLSGGVFVLVAAFAWLWLVVKGNR
jgi:hypothetical protein